MTADFTFDPNGAPTTETLQSFFQALLTQGPKPTVSLGAVTGTAAQAWLIQMRDNYSAAIGKRSDLIKNMNIWKRVTMQDLTGP